MRMKRKRILHTTDAKRIFLCFLLALPLGMLPGYVQPIKAQNMEMSENLLNEDPELKAIVSGFAFGEVQRHGGQVDAKTRALVSLAGCVAAQGKEMYESLLESAWKQGVTPVELKEVVYQCVPYTGMAKALDFVTITNDFLRAKGVKLPLEGQATVTASTRFDKGFEVQSGIFGGQIAEMHRIAPANQKHIQNFLSANCFGDYYTRTGLDVKTRELLTFVLLVSMGGCEPQVKSHIQGNLNVGHDKDYLLEVVTQLLPFIGYPRTLNAIACLNAVVPEAKADGNVPQDLSDFPVGGPNPPANAQFFIGQSYLAPLTQNKALNCPIYNVTFEPGCRNNWHKHTGGQILIAVGGKGYYQEKGKPARLLMPGDVVEIAPDVVHWHGAAPDSWFSHLAIECNPQTNRNTWLEPVDDTQYKEATAGN